MRQSATETRPYFSVILVILVISAIVFFRMHSTSPINQSQSTDARLIIFCIKTLKEKNRNSKLFSSSFGLINSLRQIFTNEMMIILITNLVTIFHRISPTLVVGNKICFLCVFQKLKFTHVSVHFVF